MTAKELQHKMYDLFDENPLKKGDTATVTLLYLDPRSRKRKLTTEFRYGANGMDVTGNSGYVPDEEIDNWYVLVVHIKYLLTEHYEYHISKGEEDGSALFSGFAVECNSPTSNRTCSALIGIGEQL